MGVVYPMKKRRDATFSLAVLFHKYGIPRVMVPDNAGELTQGDFAQKLKRAGCIIEPIEAYTPNQNKAESAIRELKRAYRRHMRATGCPLAYWDYCFQHVANIRSHIVIPDHYNLGEGTPQCLLTGTPLIYLTLLSLLSMILFGTGTRGDTPWRTDSCVGTWDISHYWFGILIASIFVGLASWIPARRAAKIEPAKI